MSYPVYNSQEVARAKAILKSEVEMAPLKFLRRKLLPSGSESFSNVWEGEDGFMEHIKDTFPMPWKSSQSNTGACDFSSTFNHPNSTTSVDKNEGSVSSSTLSLAVNKSGVVDVSDSNEEEEDDCVILEEEEDVIEINDTFDSSDGEKFVPGHNPISNCVQSENEKAHWQKLVVLRKQISSERKKFQRVHSLFQSRNKDVMKACDAMTSTHREIIGFVEKLTSLKNAIDTYNFRSSLTIATRQQCFGHSSDYYERAWYTLDKLIDWFSRMRKKRKKPLSKLNKFDELSLAMYKTNLQKIK